MEADQARAQEGGSPVVTPMVARDGEKFVGVELRVSLYATQGRQGYQGRGLDTGDIRLGPVERVRVIDPKSGMPPPPISGPPCEPTT